MGARSPCDRHKPANVLRVSVKKVNILSVELDEPLDEAGFRHVATSVGLRLGAQRIGASVYQAEAGLPIWPYHYHHGIEEWLYVIAGAPVLREPAGERILTPGDLRVWAPRFRRAIPESRRRVRVSRLLTEGQRVHGWLRRRPLGLAHDLD